MCSKMFAMMLVLVFVSFSCLPTALSQPESQFGQLGKKYTYFGRIGEHFPDGGELVHVEFLTRSYSYQEAYHVIQLHKKGGEKLQLHLNANPLDQTERTMGAEDTQRNQDQGHYSGTISQDVEGSVAISLDEEGFSGYLIHKGQHFALEPVSKSENVQGQVSNSTHLLHRMYRTTDVLKKENITAISDVLRVPEAEMEIAVELLANTTYPYDTTADNDQIADNEVVSTLDLASEDSGSESGIGIVETTSGSSSEGKVIEVAVFTDSVMYEDWNARHPKDAKQRLKKLILNSMNNMNLLYGQPSLGMKISFHLVHMEIWTPSSQPKSLVPNTNASEYLYAFCKYNGEINTEGKKWDHGVFLTGIDIKSAKSNILGIAYLGTMCLQDWSCSLTEGTSLSASQTLTHELGHSLSFHHDDEEMKAECGKDKDIYIMTAYAWFGNLNWSPCSARALKNFVTTGERPFSKRKSIPKCLSKASSSNTLIKFERQDGKLPGVIYDAEYQCRFHYNMNYTVTNAKSASVCFALKCKGSNGKKKYAHPALEGTICENGKHCRHGQCINMTNEKPV